VREPFACGLLTGKYTAASTFHKTDHRNRFTQEKMAEEFKKIDRLKSELPLHRTSMPRSALEFILSFETVSTVIPGAKTKAQVLENLMASENPVLRTQEISTLRSVYEREEIFQTGFYRT
jgi:aryl-alcohol dehydrogenase-like predicted oxidoreductase